MSNGQNNFFTNLAGSLHEFNRGGREVDGALVIGERIFKHFVRTGAAAANVPDTFRRDTSREHRGANQEEIGAIISDRQLAALNGAPEAMSVPIPRGTAYIDRRSVPHSIQEQTGSVNGGSVVATQPGALSHDAAQNLFLDAVRALGKPGQAVDASKLPFAENGTVTIPHGTYHTGDGRTFTVDDALITKESLAGYLSATLTKAGVAAAPAPTAPAPVVPAPAAPAPAPAAAEPEIKHVLGKGGTERVAHVQEMLERRGWATDAGGANDHQVDGVAGGNTNEAVRQARAALGLGAGGIDDKFIAALEAAEKNPALVAKLEAASGKKPEQHAAAETPAAAPVKVAAVELITGLPIVGPGVLKGHEQPDPVKELEWRRNLPPAGDPGEKVMAAAQPGAYLKTAVAGTGFGSAAAPVAQDTTAQEFAQMRQQQQQQAPAPVNYALGGENPNANLPKVVKLGGGIQI